MDINFKTEGNSAEIHFANVEDWVKFPKDKAAQAAQGLEVNNDYSALSEIRVHCESDFSETAFRNFKNGDQNTVNIIARVADEAVRKEIHEAGIKNTFDTTEFNSLESFNMYNDESGMMLDSTAYHMGEENCMVNFDIIEDVKPIIWIACNIGGLSEVQPEQFKNRGIALIRTIHALERTGVSVGLIGYSNAKLDGSAGIKYALQTIVVKQPENSLDETTLINLFADCSAFRTIGFAVRATITNDEDTGGTRKIDKGALKLSHANGHTTVILPYDNMKQYFCADKATQWTFDQVKKQAAISI